MFSKLKIKLFGEDPHIKENIELKKELEALRKQNKAIAWDFNKLVDIWSKGQANAVIYKLTKKYDEKNDHEILRRWEYLCHRLRKKH